jgi:hypothetical protein
VLRNVLVNTVVDGVHPDTLTESETAIARIRGDTFRQRPAKAQVEEISDTSVRDVLMRPQNLRINELRNRVVHKNAYQPRRAEVEESSHEREVEPSPEHDRLTLIGPCKRVKLTKDQ